METQWFRIQFQADEENESTADKTRDKALLFLNEHNLLPKDVCITEATYDAVFTVNIWYMAAKEL